MKVGIDCDGVLAKFESGFVPLIKKVTGRDLIPDDYMPTEWEWPTAVGYDKKEEGLAWTEVKKNPDFWYDLEPYPDTVDFLIKMMQLEHDGHEIYYITHRMGIAPKRQTERWLQRRWHLEEGYTVLVSGNKGPIAQGLKLDYFIDDKPSNCIDVAGAMGLHCKVYLLDRPWNQEFTDLRYIKRIYSLQEFLREISA